MIYIVNRNITDNVKFIYQTFSDKNNLSDTKRKNISMFFLKKIYTHIYFAMRLKIIFTIQINYYNGVLNLKTE